jgi:hypothetical protein
MSYYDHSEWLKNQENESKRRLEEQQEKWAKEQKNIILGEIKQLKGNPGDLNKVYTKKEINAIKKTDIKEFKEELMYEQKEQLKEEKRDFDYAVKNYKMLIAQCKNDYNKTKKRLSKINKENLDIIMEELNKKWEKQWGISKKGTRKNK